VHAVDTVAAKLALIQRAEETGTPIISCMGAGNKLDPGQFRVADIYQTSVCPLARGIRSECRKRNIEFQYRPDRRISLKFRLTDAGQEKWTRARTLGWYYEPEQIEKRIANYAAFVRGEINYAPKTKIIDTTQERFAEAPGLERWAMLRNMQEASRMINFLTERGLTSPDDLNDRALHEFDRRMKLVADLNEIQKKLEADGFEDVGGEFTYIPNDLKDVTPEQRETINKMVDKLEEFDDVQTVYTNMKPE